MAKIESMNENKPKKAPVKKALKTPPKAHPELTKPQTPRRRPTPKPPMAAQPPHEERLTAAEWAERIEAENEAKKAEEARLQAEEEAQQEQPLTREQFLAMQNASQQQPKTAAVQPLQKRRSFFMDRLAANADSALGVPPKPKQQPPVHPAIGPNPYAQGMPQQPANSPPLQQQQTGPLQEFQGNSPNSGIFGSMKTNPLLAGFVTFIGLLIVEVGTYIPGSLVTVLATDGIGLALFVFGLVFVAGHLKKMMKR